MTEDNGPQGTREGLVASRMGWINDHLQVYLADGRKGHLVDVRDMGGYEFTPTLLLKTIGRKSGRPLIVPLLYGLYGDAVIIVGSKGGHPEHPAWFLNMQAQEEVTFQIVEDRFIGPWHVAEGAERAKIWDYLVDLYPAYADYQKSTDRPIPVIALTRRQRIDAL
jgi:deazaflavin-dependent oxidoreductase (nitroreductase family)